MTISSPCRVSRRLRPTAVAASAPPIVPALAMRKRRRSQSGMGVADGGGSRGCGSGGDAAGELQQRSEHREAGADRDHPPDQRVERLRLRVALTGEGGQEPEDHEERGPIAEPAAGQDAGAGGDRDRHQHDDHLERGLVVRAEQGDHEVLRARGLERDDDVADGDDEGRRAGDEAGEELGGRDRDQPCDGAGERGGPRRSTAGGAGSGNGRGCVGHERCSLPVVRDARMTTAPHRRPAP